MQNKKPVFILYFLLSLPIFGFTQKQALETIVQQDLKRHLTFIASDSLQGRMIGTGNGLEIAAGYLKKTIEEMGLKPGAPDYSQKVEILEKAPVTEKIFMEAVNKNGKPVLHTGDIIALDSRVQSVFFESEAVFAGFGWKDSVSGYDDFKDLDLNGKIVFVAEGNPEIFTDGNKSSNNAAENFKTDEAFKAGAKAVVLVTSPKDRQNKTFQRLERYSKRQSLQLNTPSEEGRNYFITTSDVADKFLGGKNKYRKYLASISGENKPNSFALKDKIRLSYCVNSKVIESENVIGIVEGSDPELKNECVVYMAHYDHLGVADDGDVYNGADDNGSGTVTLLEVAEAFSSLETKPKRSIVFLWVTSEELGMFGSNYYSQHPVFPMEKTAVCINLDMVGRVYEPRDSVWNKSPKLVKDFDGIFTLTNNVWPGLQQISDSICSELGLIPDNTLPSNFLRSSDHYNFHKNGVPILNVANGYHADYHKPTDEISKINFDKMKRVADFVFMVGMEVANRQETKQP